MIEFIKNMMDVILHMDTYLASWSVQYGYFIYIMMFLVIFIETGLIVMPFLPGDSLLFALGAMTALDASVLQQAAGAGAGIGTELGTVVNSADSGGGIFSFLMAPLSGGLSIYVLMFSLMVAAIVGDNLNYSIGRYMGPKVFNKTDSWIFNQSHLNKTQKFYEKYGAKAIILARFVPIVRTFVPFVAGVGQMNRKTFTVTNIVGGVLWINIFLWAGHIFGNMPVVKRNFHIVIFGVIAVSVLPILVEWIRNRYSQNKQQSVHTN